MVKKKDTNNIDYEIKFYEGVLDKKQDFTEALVVLGDLYTKRGFYEKGLNVDQKLVKLKPDDPIVYYNLACSYSLLEDLRQALSAIKKAFHSGYDDFRHLERDDDLYNLRKDKRFQSYFVKMRDSQSSPKNVS